MQSQAVVLHNDTKSKSLVPFVGRSIHEFNTYLGNKAEKFFSKVVIRSGRDPSALASDIEQFFGSNPGESQSRLDHLYDGDIEAGIEKEVTHLKKNCLKLLSGAWPQSSSEITQWAVFDFVIVLITRYPGIRNLFCQHKDIPDPPDHVRISENWLREGHTSGLEFDFYREFAAFCLHKSRVVEIVERTKPSDLARIASADHDDECQNYVPIEELLGYCRWVAVIYLPSIGIVVRDGPDFPFERLSATRYLATTLQLPAFWLHDMNSNRYADILSNICEVVRKLIEDTDSNDPSAEEKNVWIPIALNSIDETAHVLLIGIESFMSKPFMSRLVTPELFTSKPPALTLLLSKFRELDMKTRFPLSSPIALSMFSRLSSGSVQNTDSDVTQAVEQALFITETDDTGSVQNADMTHWQAPEQVSFMTEADDTGSIGQDVESEDSQDRDKNEKTAVVLNWKHDASILKVFIHPGDQWLNGFMEPPKHNNWWTLDEELPEQYYSEVSMREDAEVVIRYYPDQDEGVLEIERMDNIIGVHAERVIRVQLPKKDLHRLPFILEGIAMFRYHLLRLSSDQEMIQDVEHVCTDGVEKVEINLYQLGTPRLTEGGYRQPRSPETNLLEKNRARIKHSEDERYGFKVVNYTRHNFFPYLFYFDPSDYSIQRWSYPYARRANPPLHAFSGEEPGEVMVGYGHGGGDPIQFTSGDMPEDTGFMKLFVSDVNVDMGHIAQEAVVQAATTSKRKAFKLKKADDKKLWGGSMAVITVYSEDVNLPQVDSNLASR